MGVRGRARRRVMTAVAALSLLAVGGCAADEPVATATSPAPTVVSSPTPSPSPTVELWRLPEQPDAMGEPTTDGAIAAATYVLQLYGYTFATRDTGPWRAITLDTCGLCTGVIEDVDQMVTAGDRSTGATVTVESASAVEIAEDRWFSVDLVAAQGEAVRTAADGSVVGTDPPGRYQAVFALSWSDGWRVDELGLAELDADGNVIGG